MSSSLTLTGLREHFMPDERRGNREESSGGNTPKAKREGRERAGEERERVVKWEYGQMTGRGG